MTYVIQIPKRLLISAKILWQATVKTRYINKYSKIPINFVFILSKIYWACRRKTRHIKKTYCSFSSLCSLCRIYASSKKLYYCLSYARLYYIYYTYICGIWIRTRSLLPEDIYHPHLPHESLKVYWISMSFASTIRRNVWWGLSKKLLSTELYQFS